MDEPRRLLERVLRTLMPGEGLLSRTITGGIWVSLSGVLDRGLQLGMVVVLARLLDPAAFGLMGIALLVLQGLYELSKLGIDAALIQRAEANVDAYLNTAWCLGLARGIVLAAVAFALAPFVGTFFDAPRATTLIRVLAVAPLIVGLKNPGVMYLQKDLEFHKEFAYQLSARIVQVAVTIGYGVVFGTVWALVFGHLAKQVVTVIASYLIHNYRPRPAFDTGYARELLGYGRWIFVSMLLAFLGAQGDDAFVGWALGMSALGLYQLAYRFSNAPATEITHTLSNVLFPAYARLQDDVNALQRGYLDALQLTALIAFPAAIGLVVTARPFVSGVLGEQWLAMVLPLQVLAIYGLVRALRSTTVPLFRAIGCPEYETYTRVLKLLVILLVIYPLTIELNLAGTALAILASACVVGPVAGYLAIRVTESTLRQLIERLGYPVVGSVVMGACVTAIGETVSFGSALLELLVSVTVGVVVYGAVMLGLEHRFECGIRRLVRTIQRGTQ